MRGFWGVFIVVLQVHLVQLLWEFEGLGLGFTFMNFGLGSGFTFMNFGMYIKSECIWNVY